MDYSSSPLGCALWNPSDLAFFQGAQCLVEDERLRRCAISDGSAIGYIFTLAGEAISWKSLKQTITTSSIMYAKFVACYEAIRKVNRLKKFILGLKVIDDVHKPLKLYCDNNPVVCYAHNNKVLFG